VELVDAPARPGAPSAELVGALVSATEARIAEVDPVALVPTQEVTRARTWALAAAAANLVLVAALPAFVGAGWRHLLFAPATPFDGAQISAVPLVGDLTATLEAPSYSKRKTLELPSSSGDLRGLP